MRKLSPDETAILRAAFKQLKEAAKIICSMGLLVGDYISLGIATILGVAAALLIKLDIAPTVSFIIVALCLCVGASILLDNAFQSIKNMFQTKKVEVIVEKQPDLTTKDTDKPPD